MKGVLGIMKKDFRRRQSINYKIKFWFYRLTFRDIKDFINKIFSFSFEFITGAIMFLILFIIAALFR